MHIQMLSNVVLDFIILKLNDVSINLSNFYYERFHFWRFLRLCAPAKSRGTHNLHNLDLFNPFTAKCGQRQILTKFPNFTF